MKIPSCLYYRIDRNTDLEDPELSRFFGGCVTQCVTQRRLRGRQFFGGCLMQCVTQRRLRGRQFFGGCVMQCVTQHRLRGRQFFCGCVTQCVTQYRARYRAKKKASKRIRLQVYPEKAPLQTWLSSSISARYRAAGEQKKGHRNAFGCRFILKRHFCRPGYRARYRAAGEQKKRSSKRIWLQVYIEKALLQTWLSSSISGRRRAKKKVIKMHSAAGLF